MNAQRLALGMALLSAAGTAQLVKIRNGNPYTAQNQFAFVALANCSKQECGTDSVTHADKCLDNSNSFTICKVGTGATSCTNSNCS